MLVPGPPLNARLTVIGNEAIKVSFDPSEGDGGSPVTSYTVSETNF